MHVDDAIRLRRTHKFFAGGPIDDATLVALVELACQAPNHEFTEPWQFYVVRGERLAAMKDAALEALAAAAKGGDEASSRRLEQKRNKLARRLDGAGAVVVATWQRSPADATRDREDYAATCCAVQNLLLGATARGIVGLWSTGAVLQVPAMRAFYGVGEGEEVTAVVFLGWPATTLQGRRYRGLDQVMRWV